VGIKLSLLNIYDKQYKKLLLITIFLLLFAIGFLCYQYATTGEFVQKGVSLKGGITVTIPISNAVDTNLLQSNIASNLPNADIGVRTVTEAGRLKAIIVEAADVEIKELEAAIETAGIQLIEDQYTIESMGSALGQRFFKQTLTAIIIAFFAMGIVVFITFRKTVPSLFVILAASSDMICTLAVVSALGVKLSTAGVAAFLMLIGYSVDTDILLTTRVIRRKEGAIFQRILGAMKTGMTMSMTSFLAAIVAYTFTTSDVIKQIMLIIIIGLAFDMLNTWIQNAGILRWHLERKAKKQ
jgi:preprotein translocase subunit SecF